MKNIYNNHGKKGKKNIFINTNENDNLNKNNENKGNKKNIILSVICLLILIIVSVIIAITINKDRTNDPAKKNNDPNSIIQDKQPESKKIDIIDINSKTRPYAVMINCHNGALPQSGLQNAYIVYELMVEGGITRMMALFKDRDVEKIGSVRSARTQYLDYVYENDAIYVHAGGAEDALKRISGENINDIDVDREAAYGFRDKNLKRSLEHTLFTSSNLLDKGKNDKKIRQTTETTSLLKYTVNEINKDTYDGSNVANNISIKYSDYRTSNYTYDADNKVYLRSMNNTPNTDLITGEQYKVKNIILYGVKYTTYTDHGYSGYQSISNVGKGEGLYITNGYSFPITWEKSDKNSKTIYKLTSTGKELEVNDGNTYIQIYPTSGNLKIS